MADSLDMVNMSQGKNVKCKVFANILRLIAIVHIIFFVAGCSVTHRVSYEDGEGKIPKSTFSKIKNGKTDKQWIVNQLGPPYSIAYNAEKKELYTYRFISSEVRHANLMFFLRYSGVERDIDYYHVVFDGKKVTKHWRDKFPVVQGFEAASTKQIVSAPATSPYNIAEKNISNVEPQSPNQ